MNGRDLLWAALSGNPTPRVPVAPFIYSNVVNEYNGGEPPDPIKSGLDLYKRFGFDILLRNFIIGDYLDEAMLSCASWQVERETVHHPGDSWDERTVITTPERQLVQSKSYRRVTPFEIVEATREYFIKEPDDFEQFRKYQPPLATCDCSRISHARKLVGDDGLTGTWVQGAFNIAGMYRELSELLVDPYIDEDFYREMIEYFMERAIGFMRQVIRAGADFISLSGNMANGTMAGPNLFAEYIMPYEKRVIDEVHKLGAKVIYHNCGDARSLLPLYSGMGIDMFESLTAPPYGDTTLDEALRTVALPTALSGGIDQIEFLKKATPDQVRERVRTVLEQVKPRGGFVLAASDYISEGTPEANLWAIAEAGRAYGAY